MMVYKVHMHMPVFQDIARSDNIRDNLYSCAQEKLNLSDNQQAMMGEAIEQCLAQYDWKRTIDEVLTIDSPTNDIVTLIFICGRHNMVLAAIQAPDKFLVVPHSM